jgi:hypothetical protein
MHRWLWLSCCNANRNSLAASRLKRLFFVKDPVHLDIYVDGLRKAGVPE